MKNKFKFNWRIFIGIYLIIGVILVYIYPLISFSQSTCKIDGYLDEHAECVGYSTLEEAYSNILHKDFYNVKKVDGEVVYGDDGYLEYQFFPSGFLIKVVAWPLMLMVWL